MDVAELGALDQPMVLLVLVEQRQERRDKVIELGCDRGDHIPAQPDGVGLDLALRFPDGCQGHGVCVPFESQHELVWVQLSGAAAGASRSERTRPRRSADRAMP